MVSISARISLHDNSDNTPPIIVDKIRGDETCVISFGGGAILDYDRANKLARIISSEILRDIGDIPNYALIYDGVPVGGIPFLRSNERVAFEMMGKNFVPSIPKDSALIYISEKNINTVFRQRICPLLALYGINGIKSWNFVVDDDVQKMTEIIQQKITDIAPNMNFTSDDIKEMTRHISTHVVSYSNYFNPEYLDTLFNQILLPRISDDTGARLPLEIAMWRVRKINIFAHCYGGYIALMLEKRMQNKMRELGYNNDEMAKIQSQLLIVALNPSCPLGVSKSQFISFMSGYDERVMRPENWANKFVNEKRDAEIAAINKQSDSHKWSLRPGYLSKQNGNVFFVKQRFELVDGAEGKVVGYNEHNNVHLVSRKFMDDGKLLADFARNILISGIKNSGAQNAGFVPLPPLETLILDGQNDKQLTADFNKMVENGDKFMRNAYKYALARIHERIKEQNRARAPKNIDQIR